MDLSRSSLRMFLSKCGNAILLFAGIVYFTRHISAYELGIFFLFQAFLGILSIPADLGVRGALEKRLSEGFERSRLLGSALVMKIATLSIVSIGILLARDHVNTYLGADLAVLLVIALVATDLSQFYVYAVRGELRVGETAPIEFVNHFLWIGIGAVLVTVGFGVRGIIIGLISGAVVSLIWAYLRSNSGIGKPSIEHSKSLFAFSKYQTVTMIGGRVYSWLDIVILGLFLSQNYISAYEVAWQVSLLVVLVSKSIALTLFPQISRWSVEGATAHMESTISEAVYIALFFSIPALIGASVFASEILQYIFGEEYTIASAVFIVLMIEKVIQSVNDIIEQSVRALNRPDLAARATIIAVSLNLILNPLLIVSVGFVGAAIATTISWFVNTALHTVYLLRFISLDFKPHILGWYTVASLIMGSALIAIKSFVPVTSAPLLILEIVVGVAVYIGISAIIPDVRKRIIFPGLRLLV